MPIRRPTNLDELPWGGGGVAEEVKAAVGTHGHL